MSRWLAADDGGGTRMRQTKSAGWLKWIAAGAACLGCVLRAGEISDWTTFHGGPALTGRGDGPGPDRLDVLWRYRAGAPVLRTPVGNRDRIVFVTANSEVVALNPRGELLWKTHLPVAPRGPNAAPDRATLEAPPMMWRDRVAIGSLEGRLYALDAADGTVLWTGDAGGPVTAGATWLEAGSERVPIVLVVRQSDGAAQALDLASGRRLWISEPVSRCDGPPATDGRWVVYGSCAAAVHVLDATDGGRVGSLSLGEGCQVASGVAIEAGMAYAGARCGKLFAVDLAAQRLLWAFGGEHPNAEIFTTPAVGRGQIVYADEQGRVVCLNARNGERLWTFKASGGKPTSPLIAGDRVVATVGGTVHLLALDSGRPLASRSVGDEASGPAWIRGQVIVGSDDGSVVALGEARNGGARGPRRSGP